MFDGTDDLATRLIDIQTGSGADVRVLELSATDLDAHALVDAVFDADKVFSWHDQDR